MLFFKTLIERIQVYLCVEHIHSRLLSKAPYCLGNLLTSINGGDIFVKFLKTQLS